MKTVLILFLIIISNLMVLNGSNINKYPTLKFQIKNSLYNDGDFEDQLNTFSKYLSSNDPEIEKGMKLVLQEDIYEKYIKLKNHNFIIDGKNTEWKNIPDIITDKKNDVKHKNADLLEFRCYLDENYNLYVMHKTLAKPLKKKNEESFFIRIFTDTGQNIQICYSWNGNYSFYKINKGKSVGYKFEYKVDEVGEAVIPLKQIFDDNKIKKTNKLKIEGSVNHKDHFDYSTYIAIFQKQKNYALDLVYFLLKNDCWIKDDSITFALSLANNYYYSRADDETREEIKKDIIKHFEFYKKVLEWQKTFKVKYDLASVPVIPKIFWADRKRHMDPVAGNKKITIDVYKEFIDRVENLDFILNIAKELNIQDVNSFQNIAYKIEKHIDNELIYRTRIWYHKARNDENSKEAIEEYKKGEYKKKYFGRERIWSHFHWLNYQVNLYKEKGYFKGDCMTATTLQMNLYKVCGIPSLSMQWKSVEAYGYSHNFPFYYNTFLKKWDCIQKPYTTEKFFYQYYTKPIWHYKVYKNNFEKYNEMFYSSYYQGELGKVEKIMSLLKKGLEEDHFEEVFLTEITLKPGLLFTDLSTPEELIDSDSDGILDCLEPKFKLDPGSYDTDKDGYSDLWELENGTNPLKKNDKIILSVDGIVNNNEKLGLNTSYSPKDDYKAEEEIYDVKSISVKILKDDIYIGTTYYNDIRKNKEKIFCFRIITEGGDKRKKYWVQWNTDNRSFIYEYQDINGKEKSVELKEERAYWDKKVIKDGEFLIPLRFFKDAKVLYIKHYAIGFKNGKKMYNSDTSDYVRVSLSKDDIQNNLNNYLGDSKKIDDEKNDAIGHGYDVRNLYVFKNKNKLILYTDYYNDIKLSNYNIHTFYIKDKNNKDKRWFLQSWDPTKCVVWTDSYKNHKKLVYDDFEIFKYGDGYVFIFDMKIFAETKKLNIQYRAGGYDNKGKRILNSDSTGFVEL